jgi:uncharacterized protein (TIGR00251 family)
MSAWCRRAADGAWIVCVRAQPGARRTEVAGLHGEALKIRIAAPALEDRANEALIEFVARRLGVAKRDVTLESGGKSREKRLRVSAAADIERLLGDSKSKD